MTASSDPTTQPAPSAERLAVVRRIYFYLVSLVSFVAGLVATDRLVNVLVDVWLDPSDTFGIVIVRDIIAAAGGALLVAVPIFLIHWRLAIPRQHDDEIERRSAWRKFFLYAASAVATGYALVHGYELLSGVAELVLGVPSSLVEISPSRWLYLTLMIVANLALIRYFFFVLVQDGDYGLESGRAGTIRRLYMLLATVVGLVLIILGAAQIVEAPWRLFAEQRPLSVGPIWWNIFLADGIAKFLIGGLLWRVNWLRWQQIIANHPDEAHTILRSAALYVSVLISATATLVPIAMALDELLLLALRSDTGSLRQTLDNMSDPISYIPVGVVAWLWHWRFLRQSMMRYGESDETVLIRRIYTYLVAAIGLALLWFGVAEIIRSLLDWFFIVNNWGRASTVETGSLWSDSLATGLSLLIVGAPVWSIHWRAGQAIAMRADETGLSERASGPRRTYLYGVALVGALLILFDWARVVYRILLLALGDPDATFFSANTAEEMARAVIAVIFWLVHVRAIRLDGRLGAQLPDTTPTTTVRTRTDDQVGDRAALTARIEQLEIELATLRAQLLELETSK